MTHELPGIAGTVQRLLRTTIGKRFRRFALAAIAALTANQLTLTICLGPLHWTAGRSAITAWVVAASVSYIVSRWAWERRGRPQVLKETIPFWAVAISAAIVMTLTTKYANQQALAMHLGNTQRVIFDDVANLLANCVTFVSRFLIFHFFLFADKRPAEASAVLHVVPHQEGEPGAAPVTQAGSQPGVQAAAEPVPAAGARPAAGTDGSPGGGPLVAADTPDGGPLTARTGFPAA